MTVDATSDSNHPKITDGSNATKNLENVKEKWYSRKPASCALNMAANNR